MPDTAYTEEIIYATKHKTDMLVIFVNIWKLWIVSGTIQITCLSRPFLFTKKPKYIYPLGINNLICAHTHTHTHNTHTLTHTHTRVCVYYRRFNKSLHPFIPYKVWNYNLRISGIPEQEQEDTTEAVMAIAKGVMKLDPPLQPNDVEVSHRPPKPRNSKPGEPRQVIVRFRSKATRYSVISNRKNLKDYNEESACRIYINEDQTSTRARFFSTVRALQKNIFWPGMDLQWKCKS